MSERNGVVHVCPEKDIVCGDRPNNWCDDCPLHRAERTAFEAWANKEYPHMSESERMFARIAWEWRASLNDATTAALYCWPALSAVVTTHICSAHSWIGTGPCPQCTNPTAKRAGEA